MSLSMRVLFVQLYRRAENPNKQTHYLLFPYLDNIYIMNLAMKYNKKNAEYSMHIENWYVNKLGNCALKGESKSSHIRYDNNQNDSSRSTFDCLCRKDMTSWACTSQQIKYIKALNYKFKTHIFGQSSSYS